MGAYHRGSKSGGSLLRQGGVAVNRAGALPWMTALSFMQVRGSGDPRLPLRGCPTAPGHHLHTDWASAFYKIQGLATGQQCPGGQWSTWQGIPDLYHHPRWEGTALGRLQSSLENLKGGIVKSVLLFSFYIRRNWGPESLSKLWKVTQLKRSRDEIETQADELQRLVFSH